MRLIQFPIGIFGVAMGMALLPSLSEHAVRGKYDQLSKDFSFALRLLFFITVPAMAGLIALREPIVNILFQRGKFDYAATAGTAEALLFYSLGIWSIVGVRVVTACFYSMQDTKTPVKVAVVALVANVLLSLLLMQPLKHSGLALANTLASVVNFVLLFTFLKKKLISMDAKRIVSSFLKTLTASILMGALAMLILHGDWWTHHEDTLRKAFALAGTIGACIILYIVLGFVMRNEECFYVLRTIREKISR
jgi:putative peptidoglycan lipid II flippase